MCYLLPSLAENQSNMPENDFLNDPLNTLEAIKDSWIASPLTCIDVSSADMLQFAAFFAFVRQMGAPESLASGTATVLAKREDLKTGFEWGREDASDCDTAWTHNLPAFHTPHSGNPLNAPRCHAAGQEIKEKMMVRNGFSRGEGPGEELPPVVS